MGAVTKIARPTGPPSAKTTLLLASKRTGTPEFFMDLPKKFPRLAYLRLGTSHLYLTTSASLVRELCTTNRAALQLEPTAVRTPELTDEVLRQRFGHIKGAVESITDNWRDGQPIDVHFEMRNTALLAIGHILFGTTFEERLGAINETLEDLAHDDQPIAGSHRRPFEQLTDRQRLRRSKAAHQNLVELSYTTGALDCAPGIETNRLTALLATGREDVASLASWTWSVLSRNPDMAARVHEETDAAIGVDGQMTAHDMEKFPFLNAVVAETMRLYPPAWLVRVSVRNEFKLDGWDIPSGSSIAFSPYALQRDIRYWDNATDFEPQRWLDQSGNFDVFNAQPTKGAWLPLGLDGESGARQWLGRHATVALVAMLAKQWRIQIPAGHDSQILARRSLEPAGGLPATLRARRL